MTNEESLRDVGGEKVCWRFGKVKGVVKYSKEEERCEKEEGGGSCEGVGQGLRGKLNRVGVEMQEACKRKV